jgi:hypothetical protein
MAGLRDPRSDGLDHRWLASRDRSRRDSRSWRGPGRLAQGLRMVAVRRSSRVLRPDLTAVAIDRAARPSLAAWSGSPLRAQAKARRARKYPSSRRDSPPAVIASWKSVAARAGRWPHLAQHDGRVAGRVQPGLQTAYACEQASDPVLPMLLSVHVGIVAYATDESRQAHKDRG